MRFNKFLPQQKPIQYTDDNKPPNLLHWKQQRLKLQQSEGQEPIVILQSGEAIFSNAATSKKLMTHQIYSKMIGINIASKNVSQFVCPPYLVDKYACAFILKHNLLKCSTQISNKKGVKIVDQLQNNDAYLVYQYFVKERFMYLIDGHKFGGQFLAYQHNPDSNHATYLIFMKKANDNMNNMSRLAGICKKIGILASVSKLQQSSQKRKIICQQIEPRLTEQRKQALPPKGTAQLLRFKKLIGYK